MDAPFHKDIARAPEGTICKWVTCSDGMRIRVAGWKTKAKSPSNGTCLLFQGRTEFIEKYGLVAQQFIARGYDVVAVDWRGQGLSTRFGQHRTIGHVEEFADYQLDIEAISKFIADNDFPAPSVMVCHSMGGAIGLRALYNGFKVDKAIFSAPMWGIYLSTMMKPVANAVSKISAALDRAENLAPTTKLRNYVIEQPFEGNTLTNNPEEYAFLQNQLLSYPDLELGGPSVHWTTKALEETKIMSEMDSPDTPCLCLLGTSEAIVDKMRILSRMAKWQNGKLITYEGAQHELFLETEALTKQLWQDIDTFLDS